MQHELNKETIHQGGGNLKNLLIQLTFGLRVGKCSWNRYQEVFWMVDEVVLRQSRGCCRSWFKVKQLNVILNKRNAIILNPTYIVNSTQLFFPCCKNAETHFTVRKTIGFLPPVFLTVFFPTPLASRLQPSRLNYYLSTNCCPSNASRV